MSKTCQNCGDEMINKRRDAKFCSDACKSQHRNQKVKNLLNNRLGNTPEQGIYGNPNIGLAHMALPPGMDAQTMFWYTQQESKITAMTTELSSAKAQLNEALIKLNEKDRTILQMENDHKVAMIKKDQEQEKLSESISSKQGLNGLMNTVTESEVLMSKMIDRFGDMIMGPVKETSQLAGTEIPNYTESTLQLANWYQSTTPDIQGAVWNLIVALSQLGPNMLAETIEITNQINEKNESTGTDASKAG